MIKKYSPSEIVKNGWSLFCTKVFFPRARLIRRPIYIRGRKHFQYKAGLTTGYGCRFDLNGDGVTLSIGQNCKIGDRVHIVAGESVLLGDNVLIASNVFISDTNHGSTAGCFQSSPDTAPDLREFYTHPVSIGDNVWIGEGVCILPGVTIGNGCILGAHSVVTKSVPPNSIVAGNPARVLKKWDSKRNAWIKD